MNKNEYNYDTLQTRMTTTNDMYQHDIHTTTTFVVQAPQSSHVNDTFQLVERSDDIGMYSTVWL